MNPVTRRDLLGATAPWLGLALAGCLDQSSSTTTADESPSAATATAKATTGTRKPTATATECDPADIEPSSGEQRAGTAYPEYGEESTTTVPYDAIDPATAASYLEPSSRTVSHGNSIEFELVNGCNEVLAINPYAWTVHKYVGSEWNHVAPTRVPQPLMYVPAGDSHTWTFTPVEEGTEAGEPVEYTEAEETIELPALGGGRYAFGSTGWFGRDNYENEFAFVATFELDADPLELTPTNAITETEWRDGVLVASTDRGGPNGEYSRLGAYELERLDTAPDSASHLITERLVRQSHLRDAIALAEIHDADHVRLEEYNGSYPVFGVHGPEYYRYGGSVYEVTARVVDE